MTPELEKSIDESELFMGDEELKNYKLKQINDEFKELFGGRESEALDDGALEDGELDGLDEILKGE